MFSGYRTTDELTENLIDAGCSEEMINCLLLRLLKGDKQECLFLLEKKRAELLDDIHKEQSKIEFLDGLLCSLKENSK